MKSFREIAKDDIHLAGDKKSLSEITDKQIIITGYKITKRKFTTLKHTTLTHNTLSIQ